ncbi:MAG: helix-turn-helix domain-containing protein [Oscillospiraceae bacterium]|nr:helix-turn-helix domain-containing protein [Oscillospiraceae bacterium]
MKILLTVKDAAILLQTSRVQIRKMIASGELSAVRVGREYRITIESFRQFIGESSS